MSMVGMLESQCTSVSLSPPWVDPPRSQLLLALCDKPAQAIPALEDAEPSHASPAGAPVAVDIAVIKKIAGFGMNIFQGLYKNLVGMDFLQILQELVLLLFLLKLSLLN